MMMFLLFSQEVLLFLFSFCIVCSIYGVQICECGYMLCSLFDLLEIVIGFYMCDWWQLIKVNFFGYLKKLQIIVVLNEVGLFGVVWDVEKMKKGDVVEYVEFYMKDNCWVSGWMCVLCLQMDVIECIDNLVDVV